MNTTQKDIRVLINISELEQLKRVLTEARHVIDQVNPEENPELADLLSNLHYAVTKAG